MLILGNVALWSVLYKENDRDNTGTLTVIFLDIGQGDAIFIEAPNGNQVLVDGGSNAKVLHELGKLMPWYDKSIDMLVATHPDLDHIGGFVSVLKRYKVKYLLEPGVESKTLTSSTVHELAQSNRVKIVTARRGMRIILDDSRDKKVIMTVLFPNKDVSKDDPNDASIVMRLTYGDTEVMLTGDAPVSVEKKLVYLDNKPIDANAPLSDLRLASDVLKVGHHGSKTSSTEEFVMAVNPNYAVISSGKDNKFGHPHAEVLSILAKFSVNVLRTDERGTIIMKSDGRKFVLAD